MLADIVEAHRKLLAQPQLMGEHRRLAIGSPESNTTRLVGPVNLQPHSFAFQFHHKVDKGKQQNDSLMLLGRMVAGFDSPGHPAFAVRE